MSMNTYKTSKIFFLSLGKRNSFPKGRTGLILLHSTNPPLIRVCALATDVPIDLSNIWNKRTCSFPKWKSWEEEGCQERGNFSRQTNGSNSKFICFLGVLSQLQVCGVW